MTMAAARNSTGAAPTTDSRLRWQLLEALPWEVRQALQESTLDWSVMEAAAALLRYRGRGFAEAEAVRRTVAYIRTAEGVELGQFAFKVWGSPSPHQRADATVLRPDYGVIRPLRRRRA